MEKETYWVGLETSDSPHGMGEDCREYVTIDAGECYSKDIHAAVLRQATAVTRWRDGYRIAVRLCK